MHYVYVLRSAHDDGLYIGYSANLRRRFSNTVREQRVQLRTVVLGNSFTMKLTSTRPMLWDGNAT